MGVQLRRPPAMVGAAAPPALPRRSARCSPLPSLRRAPSRAASASAGGVLRVGFSLSRGGRPHLEDRARIADAARAAVGRRRLLLWYLRRPPGRRGGGCGGRSAPPLCAAEDCAVRRRAAAAAARRARVGLRRVQHRAARDGAARIVGRRLRRVVAAVVGRLRSPILALRSSTRTCPSSRPPSPALRTRPFTTRDEEERTGRRRVGGPRRDVARRVDDVGSGRRRGGGGHLGGGRRRPARSEVTATVCVVVPRAGGRDLHVAAIGDSRAVLGRGGGARAAVGRRRARAAFTIDHSPSLPSERERVDEAAGGLVIHRRVHGVLGMTRAFGDFELRPSVVCEPQQLTLRLRRPPTTTAKRCSSSPPMGCGRGSTTPTPCASRRTRASRRRRRRPS